MEIAIVAYERLTALDAIGPYEVLSHLPGVRVTFVGGQPGPVRTDTGFLGLNVDAAFEDLTAPDVVVVPGGAGEAALREDERVLDWLRSAHEHTTWTTSVCTGALVLGAAGLLAGRRATTHWLALDQLARWDAEPVAERVVTDGKVVTAAGVSAGIDMALVLAARIAGDDMAKLIQLGIEYDPHPPFDAGSPAAAPANLVDILRSNSRFLLEGPPARSPAGG